MKRAFTVIYERPGDRERGLLPRIDKVVGEAETLYDLCDWLRVNRQVELKHILATASPSELEHLGNIPAASTKHPSF